MAYSSTRSPLHRARAALVITFTAALTMTGFSAANALPTSSAVETLIFNNAAGTSWTVPAGTNVVYVGLRGGNGGNAARNLSGGAGDNMVVRAEVTPGDVLTLHAGHSATGKTNDQREGGLGYYQGGDGGKSSVDGKNAGGGGGAAALVINGKLAAVAGGGGGNGGNGGTGSGHGVGGTGGSIAHGTRTPGTNGEGNRPGGGAATDVVTGGKGGSGSNAANSSAGGGGGGGGGGLAGGSGASGGKRSGLLYGNSGGGGGAAGTSGITGNVAGVTRVVDAEVQPQDWARYRGPVAELGTVKVFTPSTVEMSAILPATIPADKNYVQAILKPTFVSGPRVGQLAGGSVKMYIDGAHARDYTGNGSHWWPEMPVAQQMSPLPVPAMSAGTHSARADFTSPQRNGDYNFPEERATKTVSVTALPVLDGSLTLQGSATVGDPLTVIPSGYAQTLDANDLTIAWYRGNTVIPGATGLSYTPTNADINAHVSARASSTLAFGSLKSNSLTIKLANNSTGPDNPGPNNQPPQNPGSHWASATLNEPNYPFTGEAVIPKPTVIGTDGVTVLAEDVDYSLTYSHNLSVGTATVTITGVGSYSGSAVLDFQITPNSLSVFFDQIARITDMLVNDPNPISTLEAADLVATASVTYADLTQEQKTTISNFYAADQSRLAQAQTLAQATNQGFVGSAVSASSATLDANWNIRLVYSIRTAENDPEAYGNIQWLLSQKDLSPLKLYDLHFINTLTGETWVPEEEVTISFTEVSTVDQNEITVVHQLSDGTLEYIEPTISGTVISFTASLFSVYGVAAATPPVLNEPDSDGDGIPNSSDPDIDGDGIPNSEDDDVDGDGIPNGQDGDIDGDGIPNGRDLDVDGDGIPNAQDDDIDGDGIPNHLDDDMDGDGIPNHLDPDENGDGITEVIAPAANTDGMLTGADGAATHNNENKNSINKSDLAITGQDQNTGLWIGAAVALLVIAGAGVLIAASIRKRSKEMATSDPGETPAEASATDAL